MSEDKFQRYESQELKLWKKLTQEQQFEQVKELSKSFEERLIPKYVRHQSIKVDVFVSKDEIYSLLVEYETHLRTKLDNIPIIVLLQEKIDANKRRK